MVWWAEPLLIPLARCPRQDTTCAALMVTLPTVLLPRTGQCVPSRLSHWLSLSGPGPSNYTLPVVGTGSVDNPRLQGSLRKRSSMWAVPTGHSIGQRRKQDLGGGKASLQSSQGPSSCPPNFQQSVCSPCTSLHPYILCNLQPSSLLCC